MAAVSRVAEIERQQRVVRERIAQTSEPFDAELARLAAQVRDPRFELHEGEQQKLRRNRDEWFESFRDWKAEWKRLIDQVEPLRGKLRGSSGVRVSGENASQPGLLGRLKDWWARRGR